MRYIRYIFLIVVGVALVTVALANRTVVSLSLLPPELADIFQVSGSISLPLFLVIFLGVLVGLLIGFVWEYLREFKIRSDLNTKNRDLHRLERQVKVLKEKTGEGKDDVLALIE